MGDAAFASDGTAHNLTGSDKGNSALLGRQPNQRGVAMSVRFILVASLAAPLLSGCLARTALDVVTLPVKAASKGVDLATTSQSEADQKRGQQIRQREERLGKLEREFDKLQASCLEGDRRACERQSTVKAQIDAIVPTLPYESD